MFLFRQSQYSCFVSFNVYIPSTKILNFRVFYVIKNLNYSLSDVLTLCVSKRLSTSDVPTDVPWSIYVIMQSNEGFSFFFVLGYDPNTIMEDKGVAEPNWFASQFT